MLPLQYNMLNFAIVTDISDFFRAQTLASSKLRSVMENAKVLFKIPQNNVQLMAAEGEPIYKLILKKNTLDKFPFAVIVYMPAVGRLDLYNTSLSADVPYIQWKDRKLVFRNYDGLLDYVGIDKLFLSIVNPS